MRPLFFFFEYSPIEDTVASMPCCAKGPLTYLGQRPRNPIMQHVNSRTQGSGPRTHSGQSHGHTCFTLAYLKIRHTFSYTCLALQWGTAPNYGFLRDVGGFFE